MKRTLLLLAFVAMWQSAFAYDFSAVAPSGQTLYYSYGLSGRVSVSYPNRVYSDYWSGYTKPTGSLIIPDSVTYNGATYAVTSIGEHAFYNCSGLTSVTMPNFVTSIGEYAFFNCSGLTSVMIPNSVNSIGEWAFYNCSGLTTVNFNADSCTSSNRAFYGCNNISTFTFGSNVKIIPYGLCYDMNRLTSITIPNSVTTIEGAAFYGCSGLTSVTIPNSVTFIGGSAFGNCSGLTSVNFNADSCTSAGVVNNGDFVFRNCNYITTFTIGNNVKIIPPYLCYNMRSLVSLTIGNSVTSIGYSAFYYCSGLTTVIFNADSCTSAGFFRYPGGEYHYAFEGCNNITSFTFGNNVKIIPRYLCHNLSSLVSVTIPNSVTFIGNSAFGNCSGLTTVNFNADSCTYAGSYRELNNFCYAFYGCNNITTFTFGNNVKIIPPYLCYNMSSLDSVFIPNSVTTLGDSAFSFCSGLTSLTIGNAVTSIGNSAFRGCSGLTTVNFNADSCMSAGSSSSSRAFYGCNNISTFTFGSNVKIIPSYLCYDMDSLTSANIPNSVTIIGNSAFYNCRGLTSVTIPNSVTSIGFSAFERCSGLTSVAIPNSVTTIKSFTFERCSGLISVSIPNSVTTVGNSAFSGCSGLTSVSIPNSVTSIGNSAFSSCSGLTSVSIPNSVTTIGSSAFERCSSLASVTIGNSVTSIGDDAFLGCSGLTSVIVPNSVTTIGNGAFRGCSSLTSATIGNSLTSIGTQMFYYCTGLTSVTIGSSVTSIGIEAFRGCVNLISVNLLPQTAPTIESSSFNDYVSDRLFHIPCGSWDSYYNASSWFRHRNQLREPTVEGVSIELASNNENFGRTNAITQHNGTRVSCDSTTVIYATARDGYHFDHWSNGNTANPDTLHLVGDSMVTAFFAPNQHTITVISADESLGTASGGGTYHYGDTIFLTAIATTEHYHFSHWSGPSDIWLSNYSNPWRYTVDGDATWIANFAIDTHTVSVASNDIARGMVESTGAQFEYGQPCTVTATAYTGYTFHSWSNGVTANPYTFAVLSDVELTANFVAEGEQVYTITVQSADPTMGTASGGGQALRGGTLTIRAQGNPGYRFLRWQDNNTDSVRTVTVTGNATYTAYFAETVGVEDVADGEGVRVWSYDGRIHIVGAEGMDVNVYDILGRRVSGKRKVERGKLELAVPAGVYLVCIGDLPARKVVVIRS